MTKTKGNFLSLTVLNLTLNILSDSLGPFAQGLERGRRLLSENSRTKTKTKKSSKKECGNDGQTVHVSSKQSTDQTNQKRDRKYRSNSDTRQQNRTGGYSNSGPFLHRSLSADHTNVSPNQDMDSGTRNIFRPGFPNQA